jgi:hypothetical protein
MSFNQKEYNLKNKDKIREYYNKYRLKNKDKVKEYQKWYRLKNKDTNQKYQKEYQLKNKDKINEQKKEYNLKNKDKIKEQKREWCLNNKDKINNNRIKWRIENKDKINKNMREWRFKNRDIQLLKSNKSQRRWRIKTLCREKNLIDNYIFYDKKRNLNCDLTKEWLRENITSKSCVYCGDIEKIGCDRIDNSKGHTKDNVMPCCLSCNRARGDEFSIEEMLKIGIVIRQIKKDRLM